MTDKHIDQYETISYGQFAAGQIETVVIGIDPDFDPVLRAMVRRLHNAVEAMQATLQAAGALDKVTFKDADGDQVEEARHAIRRIVGYVGSRKDAGDLVARMLGNRSLSTVLRYRSTRLLGALDHAIQTLESEKATLPEYGERHADLVEARDRLKDLEERIRGSRRQRKEMTPEVANKREAFLRTYAGAKLLVRSVLVQYDKEWLLPDIFDDLAEVHQTKGMPEEVVPAVHLSSYPDRGPA